jgi:hypothetical protein
MAVAAGMFHRDTHRIYPAHLPCTNADGGAILHDDNGIRTNATHHFEREGKVGLLCIIGCIVGRGFPGTCIESYVIARLHQQPATDRFDLPLIERRR